MSKNKLRFCAVIVILTAVLTVIALVLPFPRAAVFWLSYGFGLLALGVQLYAYPKAFAGDSPRSKFYGFPIARVSTLYLIAQLALSLLFMCVGLWVPAWLPAVLYVALLGAAAVGLIAAGAVRDEVERQDAAVRAKTETVRALQSKAASLADQCEDAETKKALDALAEALRFSDPVSSAATAELEENLAALLAELGDAVADRDYAAARTLCAKASTLLAERNRICKLNK